jgi:hypothetical protein
MLVREGNKSLGRTNRRKVDNIKIDLKVVVLLDMDCVNFAPPRD